jgi:hypothetical protein
MLTLGRTFEQVVAAGKLEGPGFRQRASAGLQDVGDVLRAEGLEGEAVGDGTRHVIGWIDLGQCQNLADVMAGIEPALLQAVVIGCRIWRRAWLAALLADLQLGTEQ